MNCRCLDQNWNFKLDQPRKARWRRNQARASCNCDKGDWNLNREARVHRRRDEGLPVGSFTDLFKLLEAVDAPRSPGRWLVDVELPRSRYGHLQRSYLSFSLSLSLCSLPYQSVDWSMPVRHREAGMRWAAEATTEIRPQTLSWTAAMVEARRRGRRRRRRRLRASEPFSLLTILPLLF